MTHRIYLLGGLVTRYYDFVSVPVGKLSTFGRGRAARALFALMLALLVLPEARADEPLFGFTYTTDLLPKGKLELEQWSTTRFTKATGSFWLQENRTEFSYGVNDRFQVSLYADYAATYAFHNGPFGATTPGEPFSRDVPDPDAHYRNTQLLSNDVEAIYRLRSPYTHFLGVGVYEEVRAGRGFFESESKLLLQKNFRDDRLVLGFNFTYAPEFRNLPPNTGCLCLSETDMNLNYGLSYRFRRNWSVGFEFLNEREFDSYTFWRHEINDAYFFGPVIHYGGKRFFVTATFLEQLPWATTHSSTLPGAIVGGRDYDNDFERYRVRIKVGRYFGAGR